MQIYCGKSVYSGIAIGKLHVHRGADQQVKCYKVEEPQAEVKRFEAACGQVKVVLCDLYEKAAAEIGEEKAAIFRMHQMILEDDSLVRSVAGIIHAQEVNAEYAVAVTRDNFCAMFRAMEDEYISARAEDVRDVAQRIIAALSGVCQEDTPIDEPVIILAEDLTPGETLQFDKSNVLAFVTVRGSTNSHTAILARTYGIPALVGTAVEPEASLQGRMAVVDGRTGHLYIDPEEATLREMQENRAAEQAKKEQLLRLKGRDNITPDGRRITVRANIGTNADIPRVLANDAEGVGLLRSEFLYLDKDTYPTEEEQFRAYRDAAIAMEGRRLVIRTLDIGVDKKGSYMQLAREENPAMGLRAIRFCLTRPEVFRTQLRAVLRAGAYGNVAVLYPMITSVKEIRRIKALVEEVKAELAAEGLAYADVEQGIMIETPAAAMISDLLAREADFFSIGTNDLTQYCLAIDRQNEAQAEFYDPYHTAVLRMIDRTVKSAHEAGIRCCICGELGADTRLTPLFLAIGVDELSVAPECVLAVRKVIRETNVAECGAEVLQKWLSE